MCIRQFVLKYEPRARFFILKQYYVDYFPQFDSGVAHFPYKIKLPDQWIGYAWLTELEVSENFIKIPEEVE